MEVLLAADGLVAGLILCSNQRDTPLGIELNYGLVADNAAQLVTIARQENVFFVQASDEQEIRFALRCAQSMIGVYNRCA